MAYSFFLYKDAGLTTQHVGDIPMTQTWDGSDPVENRRYVYYFGSAIAGRNAQARSNPGVDTIFVSIVSLINPWQANTVYNLGDQVHSINQNKRLYQVINVVGDQQSGANEPDFDSVTVIGQTIVDNNVTWQCWDHMNHPTSMRLADSVAGLSGATPGAPLSLGLTVSAEPANAKPIHMQWDDQAGLEGTRITLKLSITELVEGSV